MTESVQSIRSNEDSIIHSYTERSFLPPLKTAKNHALPVARLEDDKMATEFGLNILRKRISEISHIIKEYEEKNTPVTAAWEQIVEVIGRG